jgi:hypothetical protein
VTDEGGGEREKRRGRRGEAKAEEEEKKKKEKKKIYLREGQRERSQGRLVEPARLFFLSVRLLIVFIIIHV